MGNKSPLEQGKQQKVLQLKWKDTPFILHPTEDTRTEVAFVQKLLDKMKARR